MADVLITPDLGITEFKSGSDATAKFTMKYDEVSDVLSFVSASVTLLHISGAASEIVMQGTASFADISATVLGGVESASFATTSSLSQTGSYVAAGDIDGIVATAISASHALQADNAAAADAATSASFATTASFATSASFAPGGTPEGVFSASIQIDHDATTNFETDEHFTQAGITTVGTVSAGSVTGILPTGTTSASIQIDHNATTNYASNEHFTQGSITTVGTVAVGNVDAILPIGLFSASIQVDHNTTTNYASNEHFTQASITALGTVAAGSVTAILPTATVSASIQIDHNDTTNYASNQHFTQGNITTVGTVVAGSVTAILPSGLFSASIQVSHDSTTGFESNEHFTQGSITTVGTVAAGSVTGILPTGTTSASIQIDHDATTNFASNEHFTQANITALGTIGSGVWQGTAIGTTWTDAKVTSIVAGTLIDISGATGAVTINTDLSELTTSTSDGDGDFFVVVDAANAQKKLTKANILLGGFSNDQGWTSNVGTVTSVGGGNGIDSSGGTTPSIALNLNELSVGGTLVGTDHLAAANATVSNKQLISSIPLGIFNNDQGWTSNAGTVTSVAGGTGIDSTGGTTPSLSFNGSELTTSTTDGDGDFFVVVDGSNVSRKLTKANILLGGMSNDQGWTSNVGTVTNVTGGTGIDSSGGATPDITFDASELAVGGTLVAGDWLVAANASVSNRQLISAIPLSIFNNNSGWTSNAGTVTSITVTAGAGMTGGGTITTSGTATLNVIGTSNRISVTADAIDIHTSYVGQTSITTLGTISTGTVPAARVSAGTFPTGNFTFNSGNVQVNGQLSVNQGAGADLVAGDLIIANGIFATSDADSSNIDHFWHDDGGNIWHFCSDTTRKATGNSTVRAAIFNEGGTVLSSKYLGISATAANSLLLESSNKAYYRNAGNLNAGTLLSARIAGSYTGITAVGTIGTGVWQGTSIGTTWTAAKVTSVNAGTAIDVSATTGAVTVNVDLSELSTSVTNADGDFFVVVDSGNAQRKLTKANINLSEMNNNSGWTSNAGTVTSVGGGTGIDSSGGTTPSITLDVSELGLGGVLIGSDHLVAANAGVSNRQVISSIPLSIFNNNSGWTSNAGTVTNVTGGTGIDSTGGATPSITFDASELAVGGTLLAGDWLVAANASVSNRQLISSIPLSIFNNNSGWTSNAGTVTSVGGGDGCNTTGGTTPSISVDSSVARSTATDTISGAWTFTNAEINVNGIIDVNNNAASRLVVPVGADKWAT